MVMVLMIVMFFMLIMAVMRMLVSRRNLRTPWNLSFNFLPYKLSLLIRLFFLYEI